MKFYNKLEKYKKFENMIKQKFQLFEFFDKFYNIIVNIHSFVNHTAKFQKLASRMISLDNYTQ